MVKNIKKIILILIAVLIVVTIILLCILPLSEIIKLNKINVADSMDGEMKLPENLNLVVDKYSGEMTTEIIAKVYNNFAEVELPKYYSKCKNLSNEELQQYFSKNKTSINMMLNYSEYQEFEKLITSIKNLQGEKLELECYRILEKSIKESDGQVSAYLAITYTNNTEIYFNSTLSNQIEEDKITITFDTVVDEEIIQEDNALVEQRKEELKNEVSPFKTGSPIE